MILTAPRAGLRIGMLVGDDRHEPVGQREAHRFADQIGKTRIIGMHGNPGVAQHRFRPGRRDDDKPARHFRHRVADMPQRTLGLAAVDLEIRDHRVHHRIPIDQPLVAVDQAFAVELDENAANRAARPGSIVKRSRLQSGEAPSRRSWRVMVPPDCSFHCQTRATNRSRPRSRFSPPSRSTGCSTTISVAMPA